MQEGLHFSLQGFFDTCIDYPNSVQYAFSLIDCYDKLGIIKDNAQLYKEHIEKVQADIESDMN